MIQAPRRINATTRVKQKNENAKGKSYLKPEKQIRIVDDIL
jgi:hypothetical protein